MKRLSASGLRLAELCPASAHQMDLAHPSSGAQAEGTGRHQYLEDLQSMTRDEALARIPEVSSWRSTCEAIDVSLVPRGLAEVGVAWHAPTGVVRWLGGGRADGYPEDLDDTWVVGTIDLVVSDRGEVIDWKGAEPVDHPSANAQLGFYGLCVARLLDWDTVRASAVHVLPSGHLRWVAADLGPWELTAIEQRLRAIWDAAREASHNAGPYARGVHCQRCHSLEVCPAAMTLVARLAASPLPVDITTLDPASLAQVWTDAAVALTSLALVQRAIEDRVYQLRELPLPGGGCLRVVDRTSRKVDLTLAAPVLAARCGAEALDAVVEQSISVDAVNALARAGAERGKGAACERDLWAALGAVEGAVKTSQGSSVSLIRARAKASTKTATAFIDEPEGIDPA